MVPIFFFFFWIGYTHRLLLYGLCWLCSCWLPHPRTSSCFKVDNQSWWIVQGHEFDQRNRDRAGLTMLFLPQGEKNLHIVVLGHSWNILAALAAAYHCVLKKNLPSGDKRTYEKAVDACSRRMSDPSRQPVVCLYKSIYWGTAPWPAESSSKSGLFYQPSGKCAEKERGRQ